jgi:DNA polymerase
MSALPCPLETVTLKLEDVSTRRMAAPKSPDLPDPKKTSARPTTDLAALQRQASACQRCDLWRRATQTVFGQGPPAVTLMIVGEQPGNDEDLAGKPFVGPAGKLLDRALAEAGLDRAAVYVTNAVKHFKWTARGKRRIHEKPNREEILACRFWLEEEIRLLRPRAILALGATAASSLFGPKVRVLRDRREWLDSPLAPVAAVTVHPSSILRAPDAASREHAFKAFVDDLKRLARRLKSGT